MVAVVRLRARCKAQLKPSAPLRHACRRLSASSRRVRHAMHNACQLKRGKMHQAEQEQSSC